MKLTVLTDEAPVVVEYPLITLFTDSTGLCVKCYTESGPGAANVEELRFAPGTWKSYHLDVSLGGTPNVDHQGDATGYLYLGPVSDGYGQVRWTPDREHAARAVLASGGTVVPIAVSHVHLARPPAS